MQTDKGTSLPSDAQEGQQEPTLEKTSQTTNTSASADVNNHPDPAHPNKAGDESVAAHSRGGPSTTDNLGAGANPLKPSGTGRGFHTSAFRRAAGGAPVEDQSAQHPGKSGHEHLENPTLSEEVVHADRAPVDPLKAKHTTGSASASAQSAVDEAKSTASKVTDAVKDVAGKVADAVGAGNSQKRSYHSSAVRRAPGGKPAEEQSAQHPGKSGHDHLENPSMSEEGVHADRTSKDPLPDQKKASTKKEKGEGSGAGKVSASAPVSTTMTTTTTSSVEDLPDGEATRRSMERESRAAFPFSLSSLRARARRKSCRSGRCSVLTPLFPAHRRRDDVLICRQPPQRLPPSSLPRIHPLTTALEGRPSSPSSSRRATA